MMAGIAYRDACALSLKAVLVALPTGQIVLAHYRPESRRTRRVARLSCGVRLETLNGPGRSERLEVREKL